MATDAVTSYVPGMTVEDQKKVILPLAPWSDDFAVKVCNADFSDAESYRQTGHDWRWRAADELYLGWVSQKYWEGTKVPRSSLGVYLAFAQIESILPKVINNLFADNPWAHAEPEGDTTEEEARIVRDFVLAQMREARAREVFRRCLKSGFVYGNGICEQSWLTSEVDKWRWKQTLEPIKRSIFHPLVGMVQVPTGEFRRHIGQEKVRQIINRPQLEYVSIKDFYIDANCPSPNVREARFCLRKAYKTVDELWALRDNEGFKIPERDVLVEMAKQKPSTLGDVTKGAVELYRGGSYQPQTDYTHDPAGRRIEVLVYTSADRVVWLGNRAKVLYNKPNGFGFINYYDVFYADVLDRFYGLAITDVVEGDQRLITSIINARVDELALGIHKPRIKRQGVSIPVYQLRRRPGQVIETPDPKTDIVNEEPSNITQSAFIEVQASEVRAQKTTGITDLAVLGAPSGGNSANRTATGIGVQASASESRIGYVVGNAESEFVEPILDDAFKLDKMFLAPDVELQFRDADGNLMKVDSMLIMNASVKFDMRASAKIQSRQQMLQAFPLVAQTFMNPELLSLMAQQYHKRLNVEELTYILADAIGYKQRGQLWVDMTPEEVQQVMQPPPPDPTKMQMQRERLAAQDQHQQDKALYDATHTIIKGAVEHGTQAPQLPEAPEEHQDSVAIPGLSAVGIEVLLNRGEITTEQAEMLRPIINRLAQATMQAAKKPKAE